MPPHLCSPHALAETLAPDSLSLCYGHYLVAPAVTPHPDDHLIMPDAVAQVPLPVW